MKTIRNLSLTVVLLALLFTALSILTFSIPTSAIRKNVETSARQIESDGLWYRPLGFFLFQIDNMTDCIMLRINATADSSRPVYAAMIDEEYEQVTDTLHPYNDITQATKTIAHNGRQSGDEYSSYARYWHGYQLFLRPLLTVFTYHTIIAINYVLLWLIAIITCIAIYRRIGKPYAILLAMSLVLTNFFIVPLALQFSTCYYIAFLTMLILITRQRIALDNEKSLVLFLTTGAITSYMDFLTTPVLTLGMPLVCLVAIRRTTVKETNKQTNNQINEQISKQSNEHINKQSNKQTLKDITLHSISWFAGYSLLWASKWLIGWLLTGKDIITSALGSASKRTGDTLVMGGKEMNMSDAIQLLIDKLPVSLLITAAVVVAIMILTATYIYKHRHQMQQNGWVLLIAVMPVVWFLAMKNHSLQHIFFTWRDFLLTLWCIAIYIAANKKCSKLKQP